jgi:hypothetical protein
MRTVLICQADAALSRVGMARWLAASSDLAGVVILSEGRSRRWKRIRREAARIGWLRMLDVFAFRLYHALFLAPDDARFSRIKLDEICGRYPPHRDDLPVLQSDSPNTPAVRQFLQELAPDVVIAACKHILKPDVFQVAKTGTFALHPGICPEYRNAHGCFWALANDDVGNVGTTLLKIDSGIDTGPIFGYFRGRFDEVRESHLQIQRRMTLDHLEPIFAAITAVHEGTARAVDVTGRSSREWGQPWMTAYLRWKRKARERAKESMRVAAS